MKTKKNIMEILKHVYLLIITFIVLTPIICLLLRLNQELKRLQSRWHFRLSGILHHISMHLKKCSIQEHLEILFLLQYVLYLAL